MAQRSEPPDPRLAAFVESFRLSTDDDASARRRRRIAPDGCVDLLFSVGA